MSSTRPIFCATHPRACSTAFERVFMTRTETLTCIHEPAGDAFYFGPERMSARYENDKIARDDSGFADTTYKMIFDKIEEERKEGKRVFIKDIIHYLVPPNQKAAKIAPSFSRKIIKNNVGINTETNSIEGATDSYTNGDTQNAPYPSSTIAEPKNPTVVPLDILKQFHFTFLIRHPRYSIPSYWRCTIPPLDKVTGFHDFMPSEAGYDELRRVFDFFIDEKVIGPAVAGRHEKLADGEVSITVIDADDLLDDPEGIVTAYCKEVGLQYNHDMLIWDTDEHHQRAKDAFEKWRGFHEDAINSTSLKPRSAEHKKKAKSVEVEDQEWVEKYGEKSAKMIRECVNANITDYEYLKSFAIKVDGLGRQS